MKHPAPPQWGSHLRIQPFHKLGGAEGGFGLARRDLWVAAKDREAGNRTLRRRAHQERKERQMQSTSRSPRLKLSCPRGRRRRGRGGLISSSSSSSREFWSAPTWLKHLFLPLLKRASTRLPSHTRKGAKFFFLLHFFQAFSKVAFI
jgi:hypothetical protein